MKRNVLTLVVALMASLTMSAQYVYNSNYDVWFEGTSTETYTRKIMWAEEDYQDLWNGCYVRLTNGTVYVKNGSSTVLYGDQVGLLYNGCYKVKQGSTWYLFDENGQKIL